MPAWSRYASSSGDKTTVRGLGGEGLCPFPVSPWRRHRTRMMRTMAVTAGRSPSMALFQSACWRASSRAPRGVATKRPPRRCRPEGGSDHVEHGAAVLVSELVGDRLVGQPRRPTTLARALVGGVMGTVLQYLSDHDRDRWQRDLKPSPRCSSLSPECGRRRAETGADHTLHVRLVAYEPPARPTAQLQSAARPQGGSWRWPGWT